jgi:hypothetical protein
MRGERAMSPEDLATLELLSAALAAESAATPAGPPPAEHLTDLAHAVQARGRRRGGTGQRRPSRRRRPPRRR